MKTPLIFLISLFFLVQAHANIGGSDLQNFNPLVNGLDFITVHSSRVLDPGHTNLGTFLAYTTNSLPYSTISPNPNPQALTAPNDQLLYSYLHFSIGVMQGWEIGASAGFINSQNIDVSNFLFSYGDTGINDMRIHSKLRLFDNGEFGFAVIGSVDFDQITNNPFSGDNPGPSFNFEGVIDWKFYPGWLIAANLGYRLRLPGSAVPNTGVIPLSDQILYSAALSYATDDQGSAIIGEMYGSFPLESTSIPTDRDLSNLEMVIGYRWSGLVKDLDFHGGFGTEAYQGLGSPDIRLFLGVNWQMDLLGGFVSSESPIEEKPYL